MLKTFISIFCTTTFSNNFYCRKIINNSPHESIKVTKNIEDLVFCWLIEIFSSYIWAHILDEMPWYIKIYVFPPINYEPLTMIFPPLLYKVII